MFNCNCSQPRWAKWDKKIITALTLRASLVARRVFCCPQNVKLSGKRRCNMPNKKNVDTLAAIKEDLNDLTAM